MNDQPMKPAPQDTLDLLLRHLGGDGTEAEAAELSRRLKSDAAARAELCELALEAFAVAEQSASAVIVGIGLPVTALSPRTVRRRWLLPLAAAAVFVAMLGVAALWLGFGRAKAAAPFATLMATTNARWADPNVELALNSGANITNALRLESGRAEFRTLDGATVLLDGPATVRFAERKLVLVEEGRVFCQCPTPESRLSVVTPQTKVVDLGTEFTVEARADESTRVSVLSGKVRVMTLNAGVLSAGEVVDVKRDAVVRLKPLTAEEIAALMPKDIPAPTGRDEAGRNRLLDSGFEKPLPSALWRGTDDCLEHAAALGRSGNAVRIRAGGRHYPLVKQHVESGDIGGRVVQASVWAMSPADDPLLPRQFAVLKLAFLNAEGREFACSTRHFLHDGHPPAAYVAAQLAAQAPQGTRSVEVQLMLGAGSMKAGSVCFDDAALTIAADAADAAR